MAMAIIVSLGKAVPDVASCLSPLELVGVGLASEVGVTDSGVVAVVVRVKERRLDGVGALVWAEGEVEVGSDSESSAPAADVVDARRVLVLLERGSRRTPWAAQRVAMLWR